MKTQFIYLLAIIACAGIMVSEAQPINGTLWGTNGQVNALAKNGSTLYVGGQFTRVAPNVPFGAALDTITGQPDLAYAKINGGVNAVVSDGSGGWYIGGDFTFISGVARNHIAHLLSSGSLDLTFDPNIDGTVNALALSGTTVYAGGSFGTVNGGTTRNYAAAFDATTGIATAWDPSSDGVINAIATNASDVYVGGAFANIGGQIRNSLAKLDNTAGSADLTWDPATTFGGLAANVAIYVLTVSGSNLYAGGQFDTISGQPRNYLAALDLSTGAATAWNPDPNGIVTAITFSGISAYIGGIFTSVGTTSLDHLAKVDTATGIADPAFDPNPDSQVQKIIISGATVFAGGFFTTIDGQSRSYLAAVDSGTGTAYAWDPEPFSGVNTMDLSGAVLFAGGSFTAVGGVARNNLAALDTITGAATAWDPDVNNVVNALAVSSGVVYAGGYFSTVNGATTRNNAAAFDEVTAVANTWLPNPDSIVNCLLVNGTTIYVGGIFSTIGGQSRNMIAAVDNSIGNAIVAFNPPFPYPNNSGIGVSCLALDGSSLYVGGGFYVNDFSLPNYLTALDAVTGAGLTFNAGVDGPVYAISISGNEAFVGGSFTFLGGQDRSNLGAVDLTTGLATSFTNSLSSPVLAIAISGPSVYTTGFNPAVGFYGLSELDSITGTGTNWFGNSVDGVRAILTAGNSIYAGGDFTSLLQSDYEIFNHLIGVEDTSSTFPLGAGITKTNPTCEGAADGSATVVVTGGTPPYTYLWFDGQTTATITGLDINATIQVQVTDADLITVAANGGGSLSEPTTVINIAGNTSICGGDSVLLSAYVHEHTYTSFGSGYLYQWTRDGVNITGASGTVAFDSTLAIIGTTYFANDSGHYSVTFTKGNCTMTTDSIEIELLLVAVITNNTGNDTICPGGSVDLSAPQDPGLTYQWQRNGVDITSATNFNYQATDSGSYTAVITGNGCVSTSNAINIVVHALGALTISSNSPICIGDTLNLSITGGDTYSWTGPNNFTSSAQFPTILSADLVNAGFYVVTVTYANQCTAMDSTEVIVNTCVCVPPILSETHVNDSCFGGSSGAINLTVTGGVAPYTYLWSSGQTTQDITQLPAGTYTVTVTDAQPCTATMTITIAESPLLEIDANTVVDNLCAGENNGTITVTAIGGSGSYSYEWSTGDTTNSIIHLPAGIYTLTITDSLRCTVTVTDTVNEPPAILATATSLDANCNQSDGSVNVVASGGTGTLTYLWSTGGTTANINNIPAGTYTVTVTDANGCSVVSSTSVSNIGGPLVSLILQTDVTCNGGNDGALDIDVSGGTPPYSYAWSTGASTQDVTGLTAGSYSVAVTDANNCISIIFYLITEPTPIAINASSNSPVCVGSALNLSASGGGTYAWTGPDNFTSTSATPSIASAALVNGGTYYVTVTDANLCTSSDSTVVVVTVCACVPPVLTETHTNDSCFGSLNGTIDLIVTGGTAPYGYVWSGGQTTQDLTGLGAGTYTVTVTDAQPCTATLTILITEPPAITTVPTSTPATCGNADGSASDTASGGTGTLHYLWSTGATTAGIINIPAGTYTVTVTDTTNCSKIDTIIVTNPSGPVISLVLQTNDSCNASLNGAIDIDVTGGLVPYTYVWSNGATTQDISGLAADTFTVTVTDANTCSATANYIITEPPPVAATASSNTPVCVGSSLNLVTAGVGTYSWTGPNAFTSSSQTPVIATAALVNAGTYYVTVTDANHCTGTDSTVVVVTVCTCIPPSLTELHVNLNCNGASNGSIDLSVSGGTAPYTYIWSGGQTTQDVSGLTAGTYTVTVTDAQPCTAQLVIVISQPPAILITAPVIINNLCAGDTTGSASVTASGGTGTLTYLWSNGQTTAAISPLTAGTYTVTVTDATLCTSTATATLTDPPAITLTATGVNANCGHSDGSVTATASGGTGTLAYLWSNGSTLSAILNIPSGTYTVTVTDSSGCTNTASATITDNPGPSDSLVQLNNISCNGLADGSVDIDVFGGLAPYTYAWSNGATTQDVTGLAVGSYTVTITDSHACTATISYSITEPPVLSCSVTTTDETAVGNDGTSKVLVTGGTPSYFYAWSNGASADSIGGLVAGTYTVTVTDANGCTTSCSGVVNSAVGICAGYNSYDPSEWSEHRPNHPTPGLTYLQNNFSAAFPTGLLLGDCGRFVLFTSAQAIINYLPDNGGNFILPTGTTTDPVNLHNSFLSELVALTLNIVFDQYDPNFSPASTTPFSALVIDHGLFVGFTVDSVWQMANNQLGCGTGTGSFMNKLRTSMGLMNKCWQDGISTNGYLVCPGPLRRGFDGSIAQQSNINGSALVAYPNPSAGTITLELTSTTASDYIMEIRDMSGRLVATKVGKCVQGTNTIHEELSGLANGFYMLSMTTKEEIFQTRIVVQK